LELYKSERLELTQQALKQRSTAEWIARLEAQDVPCAPVLTRREMISHPQVVANGTVAEFDHPHAGRLRQARNPARFSATPAENRSGGPLLGEHTRKILAEAGYADDEIDRLIESGATGTRGAS
jgi:crotonobetainyl-CoA:carnitine CoA-transferase CaiB-like acyl-CoA transferase